MYPLTRAAWLVGVLVTLAVASCGRSGLPVPPTCTRLFSHDVAYPAISSNVLLDSAGLVWQSCTRAECTLRQYSSEGAPGWADRYDLPDSGDGRINAQLVRLNQQLGSFVAYQAANGFVVFDLRILDVTSGNGAVRAATADIATSEERIDATAVYGGRGEFGLMHSLAILSTASDTVGQIEFFDARGVQTRHEAYPDLRYLTLAAAARDGRRVAVVVNGDATTARIVEPTGSPLAESLFNTPAAATTFELPLARLALSQAGLRFAAIDVDGGVHLGSERLTGVTAHAIALDRTERDDFVAIETNDGVELWRDTASLAPRRLLTWPGAEHPAVAALAPHTLVVSFVLDGHAHLLGYSCPER